MGSSSDHSKSEKHPDKVQHVQHGSDLDVAAQLELTLGAKAALDPQRAAALRRKIDLHLMPLMCIMYLMTFADKTTLGQATSLGIIPGAHLTQNQFNWLGSIFYLSYLVFMYPQNLALQRFPVGKWMSINIFIWAIALLSHAACKSFGALFAVRFILGCCEGAITPGFLIVTSMFYTQSEQTRRVGYWFLMNGFAIIILGFIAFGVLHTHTDNFMPWQWLMIITGIITLVTAVIFWFFFPDSPTTARFLTAEEKVLAVERVKANQAGVENKHWKRDQFIEALTDPKVWVLSLMAAIANIPNSLTNQRQLIVALFGFNPLETTLLGIVDGAVEIITVWVGVTLATTKGIGRAYSGVAFYLVAILGVILVTNLPDSNKIGLLFSYWLTTFSITSFAILLGWVGPLTAGHTKRVTTNAMVLIGYGIGNFAGPFVWKKEYQPRNRVPWALLGTSMGVSLLLFLVLRYMLAAENKKRDAMKPDDTYDNVYITHVKPDGTTEEKRIDRAFLDLTDIQNKKFRYVF